MFSVGYDIFDPFDLGDKTSARTTATKYRHQRSTHPSGRDGPSVRHPVYFDNIMNHRGFDVPGYNASTPTTLYPALVPQDFHLQTISGGFYRNWPSVEDYGNQWDGC